MVCQFYGFSPDRGCQLQFIQYGYLNIGYHVTCVSDELVKVIINCGYLRRFEEGLLNFRTSYVAGTRNTILIGNIEWHGRDLETGN